MSTQIKNKDEQTNKLKRKKKKMKFYWTRTHIFRVQRTGSYPLGYRGIVLCFHS